MASWVTFISKSHAIVENHWLRGLSPELPTVARQILPLSLGNSCRVQPAVTGTGGSSSMSRSLGLSGKAQRSRTTQAGQSGLRALQM